eukprot:6621060-Pyramimonas_sp.AAC.1
MKCVTHRKGVPASDFPTIYSQKWFPPKTSPMLKPEEPKSDDGYRNPMTRSDYRRDPRAP